MRLLRAREISALTGIPAGCLYRMAKKRLIPTYRVGAKMRGLRFRSDEVLQAIARPATQTTTDEVED